MPALVAPLVMVYWPSFDLDSKIEIATTESFFKGIRGQKLARKFKQVLRHELVTANQEFAIRGDVDTEHQRREIFGVLRGIHKPNIFHLVLRQATRMDTILQMRRIPIKILFNITSNARESLGIKHAEHDTLRRIQEIGNTFVVSFLCSSKRCD